MRFGSAPCESPSAHYPVSVRVGRRTHRTPSPARWDARREMRRRTEPADPTQRPTSAPPARLWRTRGELAAGIQSDAGPTSLNTPCVVSTSTCSARTEVRRCVLRHRHVNEFSSTLSMNQRHSDDDEASAFVAPAPAGSATRSRSSMTPSRYADVTADRALV
jgi:hypothetical protein